MNNLKKNILRLKNLRLKELITTEVGGFLEVYSVSSIFLIRYETVCNCIISLTGITESIRVFSNFMLKAV